jgi:DNA-directed RNA polymerase specialized sigma subunit
VKEVHEEGGFVYTYKLISHTLTRWENIKERGIINDSMLHVWDIEEAIQKMVNEKHNGHRLYANQVKIIHMWKMGLSVTDMAFILGVSVQSISRSRKRITKKMANYLNGVQK